MTQGYEANHSGRFLEDAVQREFAARKVRVSSATEDDPRQQDMFASRRLITNAPYKSIYGCASRSEFLYLHYGIVSCRIECKWQEKPGSVDEKFPYLLLNARSAMPEPNIWIIVDGEGARVPAVQWLKRETAKITEKSIRVLNIVEAKKAIKDLVENGVA